MDLVSYSRTLQLNRHLGVTGEPTVTLITVNAFGFLFSNFTAQDMVYKTAS